MKLDSKVLFLVLITAGCSWIPRPGAPVPELPKLRLDHDEAAVA